jgi:hypothetical protein
MQITQTSLSARTQAAVKAASDGVESGSPFSVSVDTPNGTASVKGRVNYNFLQPAGQDIFFSPGQTGAPDAAKRAMSDALKKFLLAAQEDAQGNVPAEPRSDRAAATYSTTTSFQGQNSAFSFSANFSLER